MAVARKKKLKKDTSFATWKFELENTINADPRLGPACLKIVRAYLDWMGTPDTRPFLSIISLRTKTALTEPTIIKARKELEAEGYFVPDGKTSAGATKYKIVNSGLNRVLDHMAIWKETLAESETAKKERDRQKRQTKTSSPKENLGPLSPKENLGQEDIQPSIIFRDSPKESLGNYVEDTVDSYIYEKKEPFIEVSLPDLTPPSDRDEARIWLYRLCTDKSRIAEALCLLAQDKLTADMIRELAA